MPDRESNGWDQYRRLVTNDLARLSEEVRELRDQIVDFRNEERETRQRELNLLKLDVAMLKVKSGLWGSAAAAITVLVAVILRWWHG
jgi:hypothetical protein